MGLQTRYKHIHVGSGVRIAARAIHGHTRSRSKVLHRMLLYPSLIHATGYRPTSQLACNLFIAETELA